MKEVAVPPILHTNSVASKLWEMKVGDMAEFPKTAKATVSLFGKRHGRKFKTRKAPMLSRIRVWRIS